MDEYVFKMSLYSFYSTEYIDHCYSHQQVSSEAEL